MQWSLPGSSLMTLMAACSPVALCLAWKMKSMSSGVNVGAWNTFPDHQMSKTKCAELKVQIRTSDIFIDEELQQNKHNPYLPGYAAQF